MTPPASSQGPKDGLSDREIESLLLELEACLDPNAPPFDRVARVCRAQQIFALLEAQWKFGPSSIQRHVNRLKQGRQALADLRRLAATDIADAFFELKHQAAAIKEREAQLRSALVELFRESGSTETRTAKAVVRVQVRHSRDVPRPGTSDRAALESLLHEAGLWDPASVLSMPRLCKVLQTHAGSPQIARAAALCPSRAGFTVTARSAQNS